MTINEVLARYPVFLLKGLPGSGKTTLLRHVTTCFAAGDAAQRLGWQGAPLLPILAPLRNFGRFLQVHTAEFINPAPAALDRFIESYFADNVLDLPPRFFQSRLEAGRCLVLLDGLDEVADRDLRVKVAQMVSAFIKRYAPRGNRFGLASRPRGYEEVEAHLPRPVVCTVQPLTPEGRDELVTNLLRVLEPHARQRDQQTADLIADIRAKEKVDELSRNPLFCTTLVLVYYYQRTALPERRVDVYDELVKLLLGFWETHKAEREGVAEVRELVLQDGTGRGLSGRAGRGRGQTSRAGGIGGLDAGSRNWLKRRRRRSRRGWPASFASAKAPSQRKSKPGRATSWPWRTRAAACSSRRSRRPTPSRIRTSVNTWQPHD